MGVAGQIHVPVASPPESSYRTNCVTGRKGPRASRDNCEEKKNFCFLQMFEPRTFQPTASRYTDDAPSNTSYLSLQMCGPIYTSIHRTHKGPVSQT